MYDNFLATGQMPATPVMPSLNLSAAPVKKKGRSLGEVIGIVADAMAVAGGNEPMYETTMARREAKARADEEYARQQQMIAARQAAAQRFQQNPNDPTVLGEMVAAGYDPRDVSAVFNAANPREGSKPLPIAIAEFLAENPDHPSKPMLEAALAKTGYVAPIVGNVRGVGRVATDPRTLDTTVLVAEQAPMSAPRASSGGGSGGGGSRGGYEIVEVGGVQMQRAPNGKLTSIPGSKTSGGASDSPFDPREVRGMINDAIRLLPEASSGGLEGLVTRGAEFLGANTRRSKADTQLDILGARLSTTSPRFQGPQSEKDVALYEAMAGRLNDRTLPTGTRIAAGRMMLSLIDKYKEQKTRPPLTDFVR